MDGCVGVSIVEETRYSDNHILYVTQLTDGSVDKQWYVKVDSVTYEAECSCRGFETKGILCKHILRVYNLKNVKQVPSKYILSRFTLKAKKGLYLTNNASINDFDSNLVFRNHLMRFTYDLARRVEDCKLAKEFVLGAMNDIVKKAEEIVDYDVSLKNGLTDEGVVRDPPSMRPKGLSNARIKNH